MSQLRCIGVLSLMLSAMALAGCSGDAKIGAVISQSGSLAAYGTKVKMGMDLALEEINAAGGWKGGQIELVYKDDSTNTDIGRQVAHELIEQHDVPVIIGAIGSPVTLAIAPICQEERVVLLSPAASAPQITEIGDFIFRTYPSDILEGTSMAKFAKDLGLERVVVFAVDNDWGSGLSEIFAQQYVSRFRQVVETFRFADGDSSGFAEMVQQVKELKPDGIYIAAYDQDQAPLLQALHAAGVEAVRMASGSVTAELVRGLGDAAENLVYPQPNFDVDSKDAEVSAFVAAYRAQYGEDPDIYAAHGYDAVKIVVKALNNAGHAFADQIKIGLIGIDGYQGAAGRTVFDENGDVVRYPRIFIIRDRTTMPYDKFVEGGGSLFSGS